MEEKRNWTSEEAQETLRLLTQKHGNPTGMLSAMIGATGFHINGESVCFRFKGFSKANHCRIAYNVGNDLFEMTFTKIYQFSMKRYIKNLPDIEEVKKFDGLYCDQIKEIFEDFTRLRTTLF